MNYVDRMGASVDSRKSPEERLATTAKAFNEIADKSNEEAATSILAQLDGIDPKDVDPARREIVKQAVQRLTSGDWTDLAAVSVGAFIGCFAGKYSHKVIDMSPKGIPVNGLLGAGAATATSLLVMKEMRLGARAAVAATGAGMLAGSLLHLNGLEETGAISSQNIGGKNG